MRYANVKEFKAKATRFIAEPEDVVILKYGKPVAILSHVANPSTEATFLAMRRIIKDSGLKQKEMLKALEEARSDVYPRQRP